MTREYAKRLHEGWPKEFLIKVFGLTEAEYLTMFETCEELHEGRGARECTKDQTKKEVSGK